MMFTVVHTVHDVCVKLPHQIIRTNCLQYNTEYPMRNKLVWVQFDLILSYLITGEYSSSFQHNHKKEITENSSLYCYRQSTVSPSQSAWLKHHIISSPSEINGIVLNRFHYFADWQTQTLSSLQITVQHCAALWCENGEDSREDNKRKERKGRKYEWVKEKVDKGEQTGRRQMRGKGITE